MHVRLAMQAGHFEFLPFRPCRCHLVKVTIVMKVDNPRSALLSDFEVLLLLKEMEDQQQSSKGGASDLTQANLEEGMAKVPDNLRTVQYATMSTLCQPSRACLYQQAEHIQTFHTALKKAGFIGGRRAAGSAKSAPQQQRQDESIVEEDMEADSDVDLPASSRNKKRRSATSSARKSKRAKKDAEDPSMRSSPPQDTNEAQDADYNAEERGPDEILPDRALTKAERLMLVNHVPRNLVELHTLVEELEMRFTESQIHELLNLVHSNLPLPLTEEEASHPNAEHNMQTEEEEQQYEEEGEERAAVDWDTLEANDRDQSIVQKSNGLFIGGDQEEEEDYDEQNAIVDDDEWINDHVGRGGGDDLDGPGGADED
ncbi:unnamed protein product [Sympodiomycopsis kandeliae]